MDAKRLERYAQTTFTAVATAALLIVLLETIASVLREHDETKLQLESQYYVVHNCCS